MRFKDASENDSDAKKIVLTSLSYNWEESLSVRAIKKGGKKFEDTIVRKASGFMPRCRQKMTKLQVSIPFSMEISKKWPRIFVP